MNITPEQIPDEVAEMLVQALIDWEQDESDSALTTHVKAALAAALPVLLGKPVLWRARCADGKFMHFDYEPKHMREYRALYTLPTPEPHNAHP